MRGRAMGILMTLVLSLGVAAANGAETVQRWGRFEAEVENPKEYANPFEDVTLDVVYTGPGGCVVRFWGFYDGGNTWRIRFMPDAIGTWRYEATFSDGRPGVEGQFECVPSEIPGMISAHEENPIWFGFKDGGAVVVRSLHVGDRFFADRDNTVTGEPWSPARRQAFLEWAQGQGYNMLSIASHYLNRDSEGRGRGWNTPDLWDADDQRPNPAEYRRMEDVLDDVASRGMMVYPFAGFSGRGSDFPRDLAKQDLYIRYTLARIGPYWNVVLMVGGPEPRLKGKPYLSVDEVNRLGRRIEKLEVFGHLLSVHNPTGDDQFKDADWTNYGILQGPKTRNRQKLSRGLLKNHHEAKPLYAQETLWGGNKYHPDYTEDDLRKNAYVLMMSAAMINFGDMNGNSSSGFSGSLDLDERVQTRHDILAGVWDFFETVPFERMTPRQDLVDNGYCLAEPGREYLIYLEHPGKVTVRLEGGPYRGSWINAMNTADTRDAGMISEGDELASPEKGDDWLLHLVRCDSEPSVVAEGGYPDIQVDRWGDLHLVYGRDDRVYYRKYSRVDRRWSDEQFTGIAAVPWMARSEPDVVVDSECRPHVFAGSEYSRVEGGRWTTTRLGEKLRDTELAIDARDTLYLVHRQGNNGGYMGVQCLPAGTSEWKALTDPDKPLLGRNNHVYPDLAVSPVGGSLHIVYRHGKPMKTAYRRSDDGGRTWPVQEGLTDHEPEAAHVVVDRAGDVYATDGGGHFFRRTESGWRAEGRVVESPHRGQPELGVDRRGTIYCACWGGRYNIRREGQWLGQQEVRPVSGRTLVGFVEPAGAGTFAWLAWEEGNRGDPDKGMQSDPVVVAGRLFPDGTLTGL